MAKIGMIIVPWLVVATAAIDDSVTTSTAPTAALQEDDVCGTPTAPACAMNALQRGSAASSRRAAQAVSAGGLEDAPKSTKEEVTLAQEENHLHDSGSVGEAADMPFLFFRRNSAAQAPCKIEAGTYYVGPVVGAQTTTTAERCANLCGSSDSCKAWDWMSNNHYCRMLGQITQKFSNPGYTAGAPCKVGDCRSFDNYLVYGAHLSTIQSVFSPELCADLCHNAVECVAWAYAKAQLQCQLKGSVARVHPHPAYVSGTPCPKTETAAVACQIETDTFYSGVQAGGQATATAVDCAKLCGTTDSCKGWTWRGDNHWCYMMSDVRQVMKAPGYSGGLPCKPSVG